MLPPCLVIMPWGARLVGVVPAQAVHVCDTYLFAANKYLQRLYCNACTAAKATQEPQGITKLKAGSRSCKITAARAYTAQYVILIDFCQTIVLLTTCT